MMLSQARLTLYLPLTFFALPLALSNNLSQPLALLLLLPFVVYAARGFTRALPLLALVVASSVLQVLLSSGAKISLYQFLRSGIPFFYFVLLLAGYSYVLANVEKIARAHSVNYRRILERIIYIFALGQLLQVSLYGAGIDLTNAASKSSDEVGRIMLFPTSSAVLLFFYACCQRKIGLMLILAVTLLAAGSKTILAAMAVMILLSAITQRKLKSLGVLVVAIAALGTLTFYASPLAVSRFATYLFEEKGEDVTRAFEIAHAKESFLDNPTTVFLGNGLAKQLTPGVPTNDERWFENSKFDIENGYWGVTAKLGVVGVALFCLLFSGLPRSPVSLAVVAILLIFSFKTSYQFFTTFDGSYLLVWSMFIGLLNKVAPARQAVYPNYLLKRAGS
ncbi:O-antigen ligase family protein [Pseudomonas sp. MIACH]|uniref:O-antigen ligase family protein n=1 Tax=Pseudomonas sp. MIACH TaxID=1078355 RepID=UPI00069CE569|nr:O-antigen ligase family protein [Pseudomonas sp. MIACH]